MIKKYEPTMLIKRLVSLGTRQYIAEQQAAQMLKNLLEAYQINFIVQEFQTTVPLIKKAILKADGKIIPCLCSGLTSGKITNKEILISSLTPASKFSDTPNINFNPLCDEISRPNFYFAPSVAIAKKSVKTILSAKVVFGEVKVIPQNYTSQNILVGNIQNPKKIFFAHYDSIEKGAVDNASGIAIMMKIILENQNLLDENLFVFAGNEEVSYEKNPKYYGKGYREFIKQNKNIIDNCKEIFVLDCLGYSKTIITNDKNLLKLCFTINELDQYKEKIYAVTGDYEKLMSVYHSSADDGSLIKNLYLKNAYNLIMQKIYGKNN